jgi:protein transport protein SEC20
MMASELSRSQFAHDTLKESTQALAELGETYSTLDTLLSSSKNLLGTLLRSQKSDTWYLETAFYVLTATIAWLVFRRLLYGPMWWLVWLPLKMVLKAWIGVFTAIGAIGRSKTDVTVSSIPGGETRLFGGVVSPTIIGSSTLSSDRETDGPDGQESVSEQVGRIIDKSQGQAAADDQGRSSSAENPTQDRKNPKKRMWEQEKEVPKEEKRKKDEL